MRCVLALIAALLLLPTAASILKDVIEAAETADSARVRKEALAAIEDLKRKGPIRAGMSRVSSVKGRFRSDVLRRRF